MEQNQKRQNIINRANRILEIASGWQEPGSLYPLTWCCECGKLVRTQGDSYSWTSSYQQTDDGAICVECLEADPESYLSSLEDNSDTANTMDNIDPCKYGYVKFNEDSYENGWYPGQNDDPHKVAEELRAMGISRFLFGIDSVGQFDMHFSCYIHKDEIDLLISDKDDSECDKEDDECVAPDCCDNGTSDLTACHNMIVQYKEASKKEMPCKCCKTNLFDNEEYCWKCGAEHPTKAN